jgi:hypothetical protein
MEEKRVMGKRILNPAALLFGLTLFIGHTPPAKALDVAVVICDVAMFSCPEQDIVPGSLFQFIPNNTLQANKYILQSFSADGFTGTFVTADSGGKFIYAWGTGTAVSNAADAGNYLDVSIRQNYVTASGKWTFGESLNANCDAAAQGGVASIAAQGQVNNNNMAVLGAPMDCGAAGGNVVASSGGYSLTVGKVTTMLIGASFQFPAAGETITLPFGDDFPNPDINNGDFITDTNIPSDLAQQQNTPEPSTLILMCGGICAMAALRRRSAGKTAL